MLTEQQRDEELWQIAKARASFRLSLAAYLFVNAFLIAIWFFSAGPGTYFWPIWPMIGWGLGMAFQYFHAYQGDKITSAQKEYEKLKNNPNT
ncbi:MAG: 2TM domain-containing protein [Bacteroidota bacterium]